MVSEPRCVVQGGQSDCSEDRRLRRDSGYADGWQFSVPSLSDVPTRKCACGKGTHKQTVGHFGDRRCALKGVLWALVIALLVGGASANRTSESKEVNVSQHTVRKEGKITSCSEFSSSVDCHMTCEKCIMPSCELPNVEFLVTLATLIPVLGCPTVAELQILIDCQEGVLSDDLGNVIDAMIVQ